MKYFFGVLAVAAALFCSCSKNGDEDNKSKLVGTWEATMTGTWVQGGARTGTETWTFNSDGTMDFKFTAYDVYVDESTWHYGRSWAGTYTDDGSKFSCTAYDNGVLNTEDKDFKYYEPDKSGQPFEQEYNYKIEGNKLVIYYGGGYPVGHTPWEAGETTPDGGCVFTKK